MMNELDNLKNAWKTISESESKKEYSVEELKKIVKKQSNNELLKIRRKFILEWVAAIALSLFIVLFIYFTNKQDTLYALVFVGTILVISIYPYLNLAKISSASNVNLIDHLKQFLSNFNKLVSQYLKIATFLLPLTIIGGILLGTHSSLSAEEWQNMFSFKICLLLLIIVGLLSFMAYWIQKRYFNWIYGMNLQRIKDCLIELETVEKNESND